MPSASANLFAKMKEYEIARIFHLQNPELYTGHCFEGASGTHLAYTGGNLMEPKRHGEWKMSTILEGCVE